MQLRLNSTYCDLLWVCCTICCATSCTANPQQVLTYNNSQKFFLKSLHRIQRLEKRRDCCVQLVARHPTSPQQGPSSTASICRGSVQHLFYVDLSYNCCDLSHSKKSTRNRKFASSERTVESQQQRHNIRPRPPVVQFVVRFVSE